MIMKKYEFSQLKNTFEFTISTIPRSSVAEPDRHRDRATAQPREAKTAQKLLKNSTATATAAKIGVPKPR